MSLISLASGQSLWRGYEYYCDKKVESYEEIGINLYSGKVKGRGQTYDVCIDLAHPKRSTCNCPNAKGRRIICKHMVALYFAIFPDEAEEYIREVEKSEEEREELNCAMDEMLIKHLKSLTKQQLKDDLYELINSLPEWMKEKYIVEKIIYTERCEDAWQQK
ncbi:MAG: SWIM zinc finger family protein [Clostridia bacterium]|nr:SWIM zinc finger family protein [Clostridia bacterium]